MQLAYRLFFPLTILAIKWLPSPSGFCLILLRKWATGSEGGWGWAHTVLECTACLWGSWHSGAATWPWSHAGWTNMSVQWWIPVVGSRHAKLGHSALGPWHKSLHLINKTTIAQHRVETAVQASSDKRRYRQMSPWCLSFLSIWSWFLLLTLQYTHLWFVRNM